MIADKDIVDTIYTMVYNMGLFYDNCDKWDDRKRNEKTWENFQAHFQAAHCKFKRNQKVSTCAGGYHRSNNPRDMDGTNDALINLATETVADRETMMAQCKTIANLTATVAALTQQLHQANAVNNMGYGIPVEIQGQANPNLVNGKHICDVGGYCWTHGHCVDINHDSWTFRSKKEGHRDNAKRADNMGGNQYGKTRV